MPWPCPPSTKTVTHISPFWRLRRLSRGALTPDDTMLRAGKFRSTEPRDMHVVASEHPDTGLKHVVLSRATVHVCDVEGRIECADWWLSGDWPRHSPTAASLGSRTLQVVITITSGFLFVHLYHLSPGMSKNKLLDASCATTRRMEKQLLRDRSNDKKHTKARQEHGDVSRRSDAIIVVICLQKCANRSSVLPRVSLAGRAKDYCGNMLDLGCSTLFECAALKRPFL